MRIGSSRRELTLIGGPRENRLNPDSREIFGIIFLVLVGLPTLFTGQPPDTSDPAATYLTFLHDNRGAIIAANFLGAVGNFFVVFFLGGLLAALRRLGGAPSLLVAALGGLLLTGAAVSLGGAVTVAAAFRVGGAEHVDAETIRTLYDLAAAAFTIAGASTAAFMVASGTMMASVRIFPTWLAWIGGVGGLAEIVGMFALFNTSGGFSLQGISGLLLGLLPFSVFVLGTSIVMVVRGNAIDEVSAA